MHQRPSMIDHKGVKASVKGVTASGAHKGAPGGRKPIIRQRMMEHSLSPLITYTDLTKIEKVTNYKKIINTIYTYQEIKILAESLRKS